MSEPITVVLVDDDALVRAGLNLILGGASDIKVIGEAGDGAVGVELVRELHPDVVLMDIRMPQLDGIEATTLLVADGGATRIIVLTTFDADDYVMRALGRGAHGFLLKDTPPAQIVEAIRRVAAGEPMLSPSVTARLIQRVTEPAAEDRAQRARKQLSRLSERELDVAVAVGQGRSNADIGAELFMSLATVKAHISRLFTKLGVDNRVQIALLVHDADL
jgi:DNA-binding NarL/FixJ family response regulator